MRLHYRDLIGKAVTTADGENLGRVIGLVAEARGEALRVTALLVGPGALARRIAFSRDALLRLAPPRWIPWSLVARIDERVQLDVDRDDLTARREGGETATARDDVVVLERKR